MINELILWKTKNKLTLAEAIILTYGMNPDEQIISKPFQHNASKSIKCINEIKVFSEHLINDILNRKLKIYDSKNKITFYSNKTIIQNLELALLFKYVKRQDYRIWLKYKGIPSEFFETLTVDATTPDYLDPSHDSFSPKLYVAIKAWEYLQKHPEKIKTKGNPKQACIHYLNNDPEIQSFLNDYGINNDTAKENEIAKIVNWDSKGGARKTGT